jgi:hypothetical protein
LFLGKKSRAKYCRNAPQRKVFGVLRYANTPYFFDILAAVKRTAIPHHATFLGWSLNGVDASPKNA